MNYPKVSIVMGVYNEESCIRDAICSMLSQTFSDFEFIIINDGSIDKTEEIILSFNDPRIRYMKNDVNIGLTKTLNKGLYLARGEYIARMDGNDISHPLRLKKEVKILDSNPNIQLVWTGAEYIASSGEFLCEKKSPSLAEVIDLLRSSPTEFPVGRNHINHMTVMFRKNVVLKMGGYNENYRWGQDGNLWYRMIHKGYQFFFIEEPLMSIRINPESVTSRRTGRGFFSPEEVYCRTCLTNYAWKNAFSYLLIMPLGIGTIKLGSKAIFGFLCALFGKKGSNDAE